ncbi:hypothetical protein AB205_0112780 [Aquarana catesbeiana]|uniref:Uncharacterized protein n=1 Tax=Aquarana catesbeiana TaxID=8400 RepID=A0A2G9QD17_AQUCT|nr:hypothetical protein AB205_0112780 [Aquarana catesbeiana]
MSRVKEDEDYWNTSKCKAFTFDDPDEDGLSQLKESKRAVNSLKAFVDEDDEDWERVTWSGEPVGSEYPSVKVIQLKRMKYFCFCVQGVAPSISVSKG